MSKKIVFISILVLSLLGCREKRDFVEDRQVRMEIGYGLEGVFPDAFVGHVERNQMVPFFQANRVGPGIEATVELLVAKALESMEEKAYDPEESRDPGGIQEGSSLPNQGPGSGDLHARDTGFLPKVAGHGTTNSEYWPPPSGGYIYLISASRGPSRACPRWSRRGPGPSR